MFSAGIEAAVDHRRSSRRGACWPPPNGSKHGATAAEFDAFKAILTRSARQQHHLLDRPRPGEQQPGALLAHDRCRSGRRRPGCRAAPGGSSTTTQPIADHGRRRGTGSGRRSSPIAPRRLRLGACRVPAARPSFGCASAIRHLRGPVPGWRRRGRGGSRCCGWPVDQHAERRRIGAQDEPRIVADHLSSVSSERSSV